ncbi:MAG: YfiR/HmsC family protein [Planctomycetota bacterium]
MAAKHRIRSRRRALLVAGSVVLAAIVALRGMPSASPLLGATVTGGHSVSRASRGASRSTDEYELKAAFLYNFARYTKWPDDAFETKKSPFVVAVVGEDLFGKHLEETFRKRTVRGRRIVIRRYEKAKDIKTAHILVLGKLGSEERKRCLKEVDGRPVLTVADTGGVEKSGAVLGFFVDKKRIRFEIAPSRVKEARLKMSSQLLRLARIVRVDR